MRPIPDALADMLPAYTPRGSVRVALSEALGRTLAESVSARVDFPPFDNSAMDGYAVRAADVTGASTETPVDLPVAGESRAGGPLPDTLAPGTAWRIFTGAPLPEGADAVVMQEDTDRDGDRVRIKLAATEGKHVRHQAKDLAAGTVMLQPGARLGPGELGLLASQHHAQVAVVRRPRVAILSTGDELREVSDPPEPGTIVNSNGYALAAQVTEAGGIPWVLPNAPDQLEAIVERLEEGLRADVLVSIGGVSVGEYDFVAEAFAQVGVEQQFWKIAIKPGKPVRFGVKNGVPVVGLPGNPVSAMVTFEVFVRPGLRRMLGDPHPFRSTATVTLAQELRHKTGRTELARAYLDMSEDGWVARPHGRQGSASLQSMVGADALVILPPDRASFAAGERLRAILLHDTRGSAESPFSPVGQAGSE